MPSEAQLLHGRWGHCSWKRLRQLLKRFDDSKLDLDDKCFCTACVQAKSYRRKTDYVPETVPAGPLDVVIADGVGPIPVKSASGYRYYAHVRCIWSHFNWVLFAKQKSEYPIKFRKWHDFITTQKQRRIQVLHTGHDSEMKSNAFNEWLIE